MPERVRVMSTRIGRGVFASEAFPSGVTVGEIDGQIMDADYASDYCIDLNGKAGMEPLPPFRFLNHSCEPNCELVLWKQRKWDGKRVPRVWLVTTRPVTLNEELTIDYGWPEEAAIPCLCGGRKCRGWIAETKDMEPLSV